MAQSSTPPFSNALFDNFMHIRATLQCVPITIALLLACLLTKIYGTDGMYYTTRVLFVIKTLMISLSLLLTRSPRLQMVLLDYKTTENSRFHTSILVIGNSHSRKIDARKQFLALHRITFHSSSKM